MAIQDNKEIFGNLFTEIVDKQHKGDDTAALVNEWIEAVAINLAMKNAGHEG